MTFDNGTGHSSHHVGHHNETHFGTYTKSKHSEHASYLPLPLNGMHQPYGPESQKTSVIPSVTTSAKDTIFVFLTLAFISVTLYFTFFLWRKHRERPLATLYKLEEYRYSRLSQNELEVDSVVFYADPIQADISQNSDEDDDCKPATLHVETDSLIAISNCKPNVSLTSTTTSTTTTTTTQKSQQQFSQNQSNGRSANLLLQDSDEDLLQ